MPVFEGYVLLSYYSYLPAKMRVPISIIDNNCIFGIIGTTLVYQISKLTMQPFLIPIYKKFMICFYHHIVMALQTNANIWESDIDTSS